MFLESYTHSNLSTMSIYEWMYIEDDDDEDDDSDIHLNVT